MSEFNEYENQQNENISVSDSVSGVETVQKRKKGPIIAGVTAGVIAVAGGGSAIAYNTSDFIKNKVKLATLSPEKYYAWVNESNSTESIEYLSDAYDEYIDLMGESANKGVNAKMNVTYTMSDGLKTLAKSAMGEDEQLNSFIDSIQTLSINLDENMLGGKLGYNMGLDFNGTTLASLEMFMDYESLYVMGRVPQITEKYLGIDYKAYMDSMAEMTGEDAEILTATEDAMMKLYSDPESIITKEEFKELAEKYTAIWTDSVSEVKQEKNKEVTVGEYTNEYTAITIEIDNELACKIAENYITAIKDDATVKDIVVTRLGICDEATFTSTLEDALAEVEYDPESTDDTVVYFETYVDAKGQIRGCTLKDNGDELNIECLFTGEDEGNTNGIISLSTSDGTEMLFDIKDNTEKDVSTGSVDMSVTSEGETVTASVEYNDIKLVNEEYGYYEGTMNISVMDSAPFALTLTSDGSSQKMSFDIDIEDVNYGNVTLEISSSEITELAVPDKSEAFEFDMNTADLSGYATEEELMNFLASIVKNIGLAETDEDAMAVIESLFYTSNYDDEYLYEDDYYYEDDYFLEDDYLSEDDYYYGEEEYPDFDSMTDEEFDAYLEEMYGIDADSLA